MQGLNSRGECTHLTPSSLKSCHSCQETGHCISSGDLKPGGPHCIPHCSSCIPHWSSCILCLSLAAASLPGLAHWASSPEIGTFSRTGSCFPLWLDQIITLAGLCTALSQFSAREVPTGVHLARWMFIHLAHPACTTILAPTAFSGSSRAPIMSHVTGLKPTELALQLGSESFASTGLTVHVSPLAALLLSTMHMLLDAGPACAAQQTCNQSTHPCPAPGTAVTAASARRAIGSARPCRF